LEIDNKGGQHAIKGGKTFLGRLFAYQEKTGMGIKEIMKLPYILFVIGMLDAPSIDYESKKTKEYNTPNTAEEEINAVTNALL